MGEDSIKKALKAGELVEVATDDEQDKANNEKTEQSGKTGRKASEERRDKERGNKSKRRKNKPQ